MIVDSLIKAGAAGLNVKASAERVEEARINRLNAEEQRKHETRMTIIKSAVGLVLAITAAKAISNNNNQKQIEEEQTDVTE